MADLLVEKLILQVADMQSFLDPQDELSVMIKNNQSYMKREDEREFELSEEQLQTICAAKKEDYFLTKPFSKKIFESRDRNEL